MCSLSRQNPLEFKAHPRTHKGSVKSVGSWSLRGTLTCEVPQRPTKSSPKAMTQNTSGLSAELKRFLQTRCVAALRGTTGSTQDYSTGLKWRELLFSIALLSVSHTVLGKGFSFIKESSHTDPAGVWFLPPPHVWCTACFSIVQGVPPGSPVFSPSPRTCYRKRGRGSF